MPSNFTYLKDFVQPVPICQSEADIGSVLCIFQHLNCKLLAIPQDGSSWGVVYSEDVIGIIAQAWWGKKTATVSHPKNTAAHQEMSGITTFNLQSIIKPVMVYPAEMKLDDFLSQMQDNRRFDNQDEYLIIDGQGELKGKLDQGKIIQYLTQKSHKFSQNISQTSTPLSSFLCDLINLIPLPMKLETGAGIELSYNKCWQQLVNQNNLNTSPLCHITSHRENYVGLVSDLASSSAHRLSEQLINYCFDICSPTPHLRELTKSSLLDSPASEQNHSVVTSSNLIEDNASSWSYLKIPLVDELPFLRKEEQDTYCLVIATRGNSNKSACELESSSTKKTSNTVTNNLLTAISHELKSPLTGIVGLSSLLNEQKLGQLNQGQTRYVELIHRSGQKMMEIIDDLLQLTSLAVEHQEPEIINLELLCRQLYQETVTKVNKFNAENSELVHTTSGLKLDIELGSEIAIANGMLLSCVLSHLISETIRIDKSSNKLDIKISNLSGMTAIVVENNLSDFALGLSSPQSHSSSTPDLGLDLVIAEYLAEVLDGSITRICSTDRCQFTLLIPKNQNHPLAQAKDSSLSNIPSATPEQTDNSGSNLTILCLYPEPEAVDLQVNNSNNPNFNLKSWTDNNEQRSNYQHRIIEADSLEQAHTLARIWQLDVIILDSYQLLHPDSYLRSLLESEYLAALPLITLDTKTTEAANKISGLNVYPCLLPAQQSSVADLMQVIQIATGT
ncbi:MAG: histidine kinase dimerization/phospho-acceptor domain-containing protein [Cyanobacteria bacterium P01_A01_bin.83]